MGLADWQADNLLRWLLDAEMDIRWLDAQLAMRGERRVSDQRSLKLRRVQLQRDIVHWELRLSEEA